MFNDRLLSTRVQLASRPRRRSRALRNESLEDRRLLALTVEIPIAIVASDHAAAQHMTFADVDGDNDVDIVSGSDGDGRVAWYENLDGLGSFSPQRLIDERIDGEIEMLETADFNGDGKLDIAAIVGGTDEAIWYENLGGGQFGASQQISQFVFDGASIEAVDLDGDGDQDLVTTSSNAYDSDVSWYENLDGLGTFGPQAVVSSEIIIPLDAAVGDLDGDGDIDLLSAAYGSGQINWHENEGAQTFAAAQLIDDIEAASEVVVADLNGDGDLDIIAGTSPYPYGSAVLWYENEGGGVFGSAKPIDEGRDGVIGIVPIDMDGDGDIDLTIASLYDNTVGWYENTDGQGTFSDLNAVAAVGGQTGSVDVADVNGDGINDIGYTSFVNDLVAWIPGTGPGFGTSNIVTDVGVAGVDAITTADFDSDGDLDVAAASVIDGTITWHENLDGKGAFGNERVVDNEFVGAIYIESHDLNGDGLPDLLASASSLNSVAWWQNLGDGNFSTRRTITQSASLTQASTAADLDGDGDLDVIAAGTNYYDRSLSWFENDGTGDFGVAKPIELDAVTSPIDIAVGDIDEDGDNDLILASLFDNSITWFENTDGQGTFATPNLMTLAAQIPAGVELGDIDNDGDLDVAAIGFGSNQVIWIENDDLNFSVRALDAPAGPEALELGDVDGDGDLDMFTTSLVADELAWFENQGGGDFAEAVVLDADLPNASFVVLSDIDGDSLVDVVASAYDTSRINWYRNAGSGFDASDIDALCGAIRTGESPAIYDFDGDGTVDLDDRNALLELLGSSLGDSNLDGIFNSSDLVQVFTFGEYEDTLVGNSGWASGDWNCDGEFSTADLVAAFTEGGYTDAVASQPVDLAAIAASLDGSDDDRPVRNK